MKRDDIQTLESNTPHEMSLKMESEKIHKNLRNTTVQMKDFFSLFLLDVSLKQNCQNLVAYDQRLKNGLKYLKMT